MKTAQIALGASYEDAGVPPTIRQVTAILSSGKGRDARCIVEYLESPERPLYLPLRRTKQMPIAEFAKWAKRPAGTKKILSAGKFVAWLRGATEHRAA